MTPFKRLYYQASVFKGNKIKALINSAGLKRKFVKGIIKREPSSLRRDFLKIQIKARNPLFYTKPPEA